MIEIDKHSKIGKCKESKIVKITWIKKNQVGELTVYDSKTSFKTIVMVMVMFWGKDRQIDQGTRTDVPEIDSYAYGQLIFYNVLQRVKCRKDSLLSK